VRDLVTEDACQLRLAAEAQEDSGAEEQHPIRRHPRVRLGMADDVDPQAVALRTGQAAHHAADVGVEGRRLDEERRDLDLRFELIHVHP
jgi:hypothetical protein